MPPSLSAGRGTAHGATRRVLLAFAAFLSNIVMTLGLKGALGIFRRAELDPRVLVPEPTP